MTLQWHTRHDLFELEREATGFLDRVRGGSNPDGREIADWVGRLERLATEAIPEVGALEAGLRGLQAIVAGAVANMNEATWSTVQLSLFSILRQQQFQPTRLSDHALARFVSAVLAATEGSDHACVGVRDIPAVAEDAAWRGLARATDFGLAFPEADLRKARMTGRVCLHRDRARRWLDDNADRLGRELIERLQGALDQLEVHGVSVRAIADPGLGGQPWLLDGLAKILPREELEARSRSGGGARNGDALIFLVAPAADEVRSVLLELPSAGPGQITIPDALVAEMRRRWLARARGKNQDAANLPPHQAVPLLERCRDQARTLRDSGAPSEAAWDAWYGSAQGLLRRARGADSPEYSAFENLTMGSFQMNAGEAYWIKKRMGWLEAAMVSLDQTISDLRAELELGGSSNSGSGAPHAAAALRAQLLQLKNPDTRGFVEEAVRCVEAQVFRAAVVFSWVGAVSVLYEQVIAAGHLPAFNTEARRRDAKWRDAKTTDGLARMKESAFLDVLEALSVLAKSTKIALKECLDRRNACGHPNSFKVGESTVAHHVEILVSNVFQRFG